MSKLLGLSKYEEKIFKTMKISELFTPLIISKDTLIPRASVYVPLQKLKKRGLIENRIHGGKKVWAKTDILKLENTFNETYKFCNLNKDHKKSHEINVNKIKILYIQGKEDLKKLFESIYNTRNASLTVLQSVQSEKAWYKIFNRNDTIKFTEAAKQNKIVTRYIVEDGIVEEAMKNLGQEWAERYRERPGVMHILDKKYFTQSAQLCILNDKIYLISLEELYAIEISSSSISKMLIKLFEFIYDHSDKTSILNKVNKALVTKA